jgi:methylmalonyl-CoA/ethylmalonyl-CoA epimerase
MTAPLAEFEPQEPFGLSEIGQIAVTVTDLERATAFYRDRLGIPYLFSAPPRMAFFDCAGIRLLLGEPETAGQERRSSILYFRVPDIHEAHRILVERGVEFVADPHLVHRADTYELWLAELNDSEGNTHALMSEVRPNPGSLPGD